jgi:hypothetical protein
VKLEVLFHSWNSLEDGDRKIPSDHGSHAYDLLKMGFQPVDAGSQYGLHAGRQFFCISDDSGCQPKIQPVYYG